MAIINLKSNNIRGRGNGDGQQQELAVIAPPTSHSFANKQTINHSATKPASNNTTMAPPPPAVTPDGSDKNVTVPTDSDVLCGRCVPAVSDSLGGVLSVLDE